MFDLRRIQDQITEGEVLVLEAFDKDLVTSDLMGQTNPISFSTLTQDLDMHSNSLDLYDKNYKHIGTLNIETQFVYKDIDPLPERMTQLSKLEITVLTADFYQDHDMFGKQDPFITFLQGDHKHRTKTADDAGLHAEFNEKMVCQ